MRDFLTDKGYWVYDPVKKDFKTVFNVQVVLQRLTNLLSVYADQWAINQNLYIDYTNLKKGNNLNLIIDIIRNKITSDPNVSNFQSLNVGFVNGVLTLNLNIIINGENYTITVDKII
jgi:hypothetical protein